jgi:hypothetical protein
MGHRLGTWYRTASCPTFIRSRPDDVFHFLLDAITEELGWMGYAYDLMERKWGTHKATLFLGLVIVGFHIPMYYFMFEDSAMLAIQLLFAAFTRTHLRFMGLRK